MTERNGMRYGVLGLIVLTLLILLGLLARARAADKRSSTEPSAQ